MDFKLTEEQSMMRDMFRDFAEREVKPLAAEIDEQERFPKETVKKMAELGLFGIPVPEEYGGQGADILTYILCVEELCRCCATTGLIVSCHTSLCVDPILRYGTEEQKRKYLPGLASGELLGAFALTEPGAGTDASRQQTTARLTEEGYVLNGSKCFITNGEVGDVYIVFAMTDRSLGNKGISAFIVEKGTPGFSFGAHERKMGIRASSTCELVFEDCLIPKENLLGAEGKGFGIAMATLDGGRIGIAAQALGIAEGAIAETLNYTSERVQFGKKISQFQNTQFKMADIYAQTEAARFLVYSAACKKQEAVSNPKVRYSVEAAMAKLVAAENASRVTNVCLQFFGGYGFSRDYPIERMLRDARVTEIYEGTSEVQRMVISASLGMK